MAFLDNSGDIILDAILTDIGRKRLAQGNFKISKFKFGDDEIDYSLYDINHPSGSVYADLTILQTPILEPSTKLEILYGPTAHTRTDLLYLPILKSNELVSDAVQATSSLYWLAVNTETANDLKTRFSGSSNHLQSDLTSGKVVVVESGLDTTDLTGDAANRASYIVSTNMLDSSYTLNMDNRFLVGAYTATRTSYFRNDSAGAAEVNLTPLSRVTANSSTSFLDNHSTYSIYGVNNNVIYNATTAATTISAIAGPRGSVCAVNFSAQSELSSTSTGTRSSLYSLYGFTDQKLFGGGSNYDYIDTTVYLEGDSSTSRIQIPLRIVRYAGEA